MSIPTDPYNAPNRRPFDEGDVLQPLSDEGALHQEAPEGTAQHGQDNSVHASDTPHTDENASNDAYNKNEESAETTDASSSFPSASSQLPSDSYDVDSDINSAGNSLMSERDASLSLPVSAQKDDAISAQYGTAETIHDSDPFADLSSDASGRTALAASVGLGGANQLPAEEDIPPVGFMPQETPEQTEARRERWANNPNIPENIPDAPKGRALVHTGVLFASLILVPVAWYLVSDGHTRLNVAQAAHTTNFAGAGELLAGVGVLTLIWLLARASSLGVNVTGAIVAAFGALGLAFPSFILSSVLDPVAKSIAGINAFFGNVAHHFRYDTLSGLMFTFGAVLVLTGIVSHSARRRGQTRGAILAQRELMGN